MENIKECLKGCKPGDEIEIGGVLWEVLDTDYQGGVFCLSKNILFEAAFDKDNRNDWRTSSLREKLKEWGEEFEQVSEVPLIAFERDLTSEDGLKDYGTCMDKVSLITCDEYRKYRGFFSKKKQPWWTITAYSTPNSGYSYFVRLVNTDGSLGHTYYAYNGNIGVSAACIFSLFSNSDEGSKTEKCDRKQATSKKGQQGTASPQEAQERAQDLKTQGRKGCKATRINMAFTPDNHEFIKIMARATGRTMTEFTNDVIAAYRKEHPEFTEKAAAFLDLVNA